MFTGSLDGRNHTVRDLHIDRPDTAQVGLFGYATPRFVANLRLLAMNVTGGNDTGGLAGALTGPWDGTVRLSNIDVSGNFSGIWDVGALVGYLTRGATDDCHLLGDGSDVNGFYNVGGLVGCMGEGLMSNSHAVGTVVGRARCAGGLVGLANGGAISTSYSSGDVSGGWQVGGLIGCLYRKGVANSYSTGTVTGGTSVGGLVGDVSSAGVSHSYSAGGVTGTKSIGGLVGSTWSTTATACFWDTQASGLATSALGNGKTTAEMRTRDTFADAGWDLVSVWFIIEDVTYPLLRCQDAEPPTAEAGPDLTVDEDVLVTFDGTSSFDDFMVANYTWSLWDVDYVVLYGDRPSRWFGTPGTFTVNLMVTDYTGKMGTDTLTLTVNDTTPPIAEAGPDQMVDAGRLVTFDGGWSTDNVGISSYTWTFWAGAEVTLHGPTPSHLFDAPGRLCVTLNVSDAAGNWCTDSMNVTVLDVTAPTAEAGPDLTVARGALVTLDGSGSLDDVGVVNFTWTFTDGSPVVLFGAQPAHAFSSIGACVVTLSVSDAAGNRAMDTMTVTVLDVTPPVAEAGPDLDAPEGSLVTFNGTASMDDVVVARYAWTLVDGGPVALDGPRPTHRFDKPGDFQVTLNVTDSSGNWATDTLIVTIRDVTAPVAEAGDDQIIDEGTMATLDGGGSTDNVGIANETWTFTDAGPVTLHGAQATYAFRHPGVFIITLNVTDAAGNGATDVVTITVRDTTAPVAEAGPERNVDQDVPFTFDGSGSTDNVGIVNYTWSFRNGASDVALHGVSPSFTLTLPGVYPVSLRVLDAAGHWKEDIMTLTVVDTRPPLAEAGADRTISAGRIVVLDGTASTDNVAITSWGWSFSDAGRTVELAGSNASYRFDAPGTYRITLRVTDAAGNEATDSLNVTVLRESAAGGLSNWLLYIILSAAMLAVVGAAVLVLARRKGGKDE
jgi:hypothetical protein